MEGGVELLGALEKGCRVQVEISNWRFGDWLEYWVGGGLMVDRGFWGLQ